MRGCANEYGNKMDGEGAYRATVIPKLIYQQQIIQIA